MSVDVEGIFIREIYCYYEFSDQSSFIAVIITLTLAAQTRKLRLKIGLMFGFESCFTNSKLQLVASFIHHIIPVVTKQLSFFAALISESKIRKTLSA